MTSLNSSNYIQYRAIFYGLKLSVVAWWLASQGKCLKNKKDIRLIRIGLNLKKDVKL